VVWYVRTLEEVMIRASNDFRVTATREPGKTGIWVAPQKDLTQSALRAQRPQSGVDTPEKLGAIGVHISRWVTSHGFAYNVSTDLRFFDLIVPCGIADRKATSLEKLLGRSIDCRQVAARLSQHFAEVFHLDMRAAAPDELFDQLRQFERSTTIAENVAQPILAVQEQATP
jgi:lipoyl(octanoyl) transferase